MTRTFKTVEDLLSSDVRRGASYKNANGVVAVYDHMSGLIVNLSDDSEFFSWPFEERYYPLTVIWEPDYDMSTDEILQADYDSDGIPARARVQREDKLAVSLRDGAL